ncbi:hypothetical protein ACQP2E_13425 [Actinoplanes sp. CA-015351]|uniref:hypothetical protein n=1 Tax=Actinoplanes sp. CA-015351 TaxID=3239897 RepID=UPI003D99247D
MTGRRHTKRPTEQQSCSGKQRHLSRAAAVQALYSLARSTGAAHRRLQAYRCRFCWIEVDGQRRRPWHIGHS